jgi:hypothetical protein
MNVIEAVYPFIWPAQKRVLCLLGAVEKAAIIENPCFVSRNPLFKDEIHVFEPFLDPLCRTQK